MSWEPFGEALIQIAGPGNAVSMERQLADSGPYKEEKRKWQAMESSKSPMRTSTRMF